MGEQHGEFCDGCIILENMSLKRRIQAVLDMHPVQSRQVGSKTHGGPAQYADVCTTCGVIAPCPTVRALGEDH